MGCFLQKYYYLQCKVYKIIKFNVNKQIYIFLNIKPKKMGNCINCILNLFKQSKIHRISGRKIRQIKQIAQGGYGYVILVEDIQNRKNYAMKKLICQSQQSKQNYKKQINVMKQLSHCINIIGYYGSYEIQREGYLQAYILMQLAQKTVLDVVLEARQKNKQIPESHIIKILLQTSKGLKQMHDLGMIHKDIKIQNILISQNGTAKLCDFGSCDKQKIDLTKLNKTQMYRYEQKFEKNTTLMYRPPQMIDLYLRYPIDQRIDVWMLGCVLFVLNFQYHPFQQQGKLSIVNASIKYPLNKINKKMEYLMRNMLTPNPQFRIKIPQIIEILQSWNDISQIKLNPIAKIIKQNQQYIQSGQYDKASRNEWRNIKYQQ